MKIKKGKDERIFLGIAYVMTALFAIVCLLPFYLILVGSFTKESTILTEGYSFFLTARNFSMEAYKMAFKSPDTIVQAYGITLFVTVTGTVIAVGLSAMTGYVLARPDFPWRNKISFFFFFTTLFSGGLVPWYLMCSKFFKFNNHIYSLILPCLFSVWNMIIAKSFMKGIPVELDEAAYMDGCSYFKMFYKIAFPLAKPGLATIGTLTLLNCWNEYLFAYIMLANEKIKTITQGIFALKGRYYTDYATLCAGLMIAIIPMMAFFVIFQEQVIGGMTAGAVKG